MRGEQSSGAMAAGEYKLLLKIQREHKNLLKERGNYVITRPPQSSFNFRSG